MPAASKLGAWRPGTHSPPLTGLPCWYPTQRTLHRSAKTFHRTTWLRFSDRKDEYTFRWHLVYMKRSTVLWFFDLVFRSRRPTSLHWRHRFWQEKLVFVTMVLFFNGDWLKGHVWYINILTWLRGFQIKLLYLVLFTLYPKSLLGMEGQKKHEKFAIVTRKPRTHTRVLISRTWPIGVFF